MTVVFVWAVVTTKALTDNPGKLNVMGLLHYLYNSLVEESHRQHVDGDGNVLLIAIIGAMGKGTRLLLRIYVTNFVIVDKRFSPQKWDIAC